MSANIIKMYERALDALKALEDGTYPTRRECYIYYVTPIVARCNEINSVGKKSFLRVKQTDTREIDSSLVLKFIQITSEYIPRKTFMGDVSVSYNIDGCMECGSTLTSIDEGLETCNSCGHVSPVIDDSHTFKDSERVSASVKTNNANYTHFVEAVKQFQGEPVTIPSVFDDKWNTWRVKHNIKQKDITKNQVYMFLEQEGFSEFYEHINYLYSKITRIPPPDIHHLEPKLFPLYKQAMEAYSAIKDTIDTGDITRKRKSSLIVNFILQELLRLLGYKLRSDDFFMLKTDAKRREHQRAWQRVMEYNGWDKSK